MLSQAQEKFIRLLQQKKYRKKEKCFIVEGEKVVKEALFSSFTIKKIYALNSWIEKNSALKKVEDIIGVNEKELKKVSQLNTPQPVLAIVEMPRLIDSVNTSDSLVLALDNVKDPGNLGTIVRIADWFGIKNIVCSATCVDVYNPKVVQASMGSIFRVTVHYKELLAWLEGEDCTVYGAHLKGENLWQSKISNRGVLLMGNESKGISEELMKLVTKPLKIPAKGEAESLNVAVATAIFCAAFSRLN